MNSRHVLAIFKRHFYTFRHNPAAMLDMFLWPIVDLVVWGFLTLFIQRHTNLPTQVGFLIGAALLWTLMFRSNLEISLCFLDDTSWTRNILNLLVTPIRSGEYLAGAALWGLTKIAVGWSVMLGLAALLFQFTLMPIGVSLVAIMLILMLFGAAMSMIVLGIIMRFGHGADIFAWGLAGLLTPLSAVWYPISVMPEWAQRIAAFMPSAQGFEAMRTVVSGQAIPWESLRVALALDAVYFFLALMFARAMFHTLQRRGYVTRYM